MQIFFSSLIPCNSNYSHLGPALRTYHTVVDAVASMMQGPWDAPLESPLAGALGN